MISISSSYPNLSLFSNFIDEVEKKLENQISKVKKSLSELVHSLALNRFAHIVIALPFFYLQHNLFVLGFVVGFVASDNIDKIAEKVRIVWDYHYSQGLLHGIAFFGSGLFLSLLTLHTSIIITTLYCSAQLGAQLYNDCKPSVGPTMSTLNS